MVCAPVVGSGVNLVSLGVGVEVMNALLLPIVLAFLFQLARRLPAPYRLRGAYAALSGAIILVTVVFGSLCRRRGLMGVRRILTDKQGSSGLCRGKAPLGCLPPGRDQPPGLAERG